MSATTAPRPGPCGCTAETFCEEHLRALPRAERAAWRRWQPTREPDDTPRGTA